MIISPLLLKEQMIIRINNILFKSTRQLDLSSPTTTTNERYISAEYDIKQGETLITFEEQREDNRESTVTKKLSLFTVEEVYDIYRLISELATPISPTYVDVVNES